MYSMCVFLFLVAFYTIWDSCEMLSLMVNFIFCYSGPEYLRKPESNRKIGE